MNDLAGKHIVLGLTGGIACYKAAALCRELTRAGATVQVVMTDAAREFITPTTMQALSGRPVATSQWNAGEPNAMPHINLTRDAHALLIAPCSADFMAKLAHGQANDLLSTLAVARGAPIRADVLDQLQDPIDQLLTPVGNAAPNVQYSNRVETPIFDNTSGANFAQYVFMVSAVNSAGKGNPSPVAFATDAGRQ